MVSNQEKTGGRKSRDTLPLSQSTLLSLLLELLVLKAMLKCKKKHELIKHLIPYKFIFNEENEYCVLD